MTIDDGTRLAYAEVPADEQAQTAVGFLRRALRFYRRDGIEVERVMTVNGVRLPFRAFVCRLLGCPLLTRRYRPQTNGKNRALHPHLLAEWAYGAI